MLLGTLGQLEYCHLLKEIHNITTIKIDELVHSILLNISILKNNSVLKYRIIE